jgi:Zn-dependent protease
LGGPAQRAAPYIVRNHIPLGSIFGLRIWLSRFLLWLVAFLLVVATFNGVHPGFVLALVVAVAGVVLAHELGHCLVARRLGIKVSHITLWPLGGVAWMEEIPEDSRTEGLVAIAGPATNLLIAALSVPLFLIPGPLQPFAWWFISINLMLGIFNLIPAFPMDGGRLLRAFLARRGDYLRATEQAVSVSKYLSLALAIAGLVYGQLMVPLIAVYLWFMGQRELFSVRARSLGRGGVAGGIFSGLADQVRRARGEEGSVRAEEFSEAPSPDRAPARESADSGGGFSDEEITALERYRGRLKRE